MKATCDVMVVEDDRDLRAILCDVLNEEGFSTRMAADGQAALQLLAWVQPRIILLDNAMPRMSGHQMWEQLQADPVLALIPVVEMAVGISSSDDYVLPKPFGVVQLMQRVDAALHGLVPFIERPSLVPFRR